MVEPRYLNLIQVLQNRLFVIPNYQRAYAWEENNRKQLFEDINRLNEQPPDRHHFMSTMVCLSTKQQKTVGYNQYKIFDVVDGQQRLTTLIILLKTISIALDENSFNKEKSELEELLIKPNQQLILLQTNHDDSAHIFSSFLKFGKIPLDKEIKTWADKNLKDSFVECKNYVEVNWKGKNKVIDLLILLMNRLGFIFYEIEDESSVYTVFEVLNSRGLPVDWLDKCKSVIMGIAFEKLNTDIKEYHIKHLHQIWSSIYRAIGLQNISGQEILRFAATLKKTVADNKWKDYLTKLLSADDSLEYFRNYCSEKPTAVIEVSEWIYEITKALQELYENPRLAAVTDIIHARLLAVSISLIPHDVMLESDQNQLLDQWERTTFRIFGLFNKDARSKSKDYIQLSCRIVNELVFEKKKLSKVEVLKSLIGLGSQYPIEEAIESIRFRNCYDDWEKDLLYFMYRYEEHLTEKHGVTVDDMLWRQIWKKSPNKTIEHIWPKEYIASQWDTNGFTDSEISDAINYIGNLCILPPVDNTKVGNKVFQTKKQLVYDKNQLFLVKEIADNSEWNIDKIKERSNVLLTWAATTWNDINL